MVDPEPDAAGVLAYEASATGNEPPAVRMTAGSAAQGERWMQATRRQILDYLHRHARGTVREFTQLVGLTPTGVRQHLTVLERDGLVQAHEERGRIGRPAHVYRLTERGDALFPHNYDTLANLLMEEVHAMAGADALQQLMRRVSGRMADRYSDRTEGRTVAERVEIVATVLKEMGCEVEAEQQGDEFLIRQCSCPYPNVARRHRAVCALEVDFVRRMTGGDARLTSSLLRGDDACTYRVRPSVAPAAPAAGRKP
jgi:DeoR family suf operon transcriptional repressor